MKRKTNRIIIGVTSALVIFLCAPVFLLTENYSNSNIEFSEIDSYAYTHINRDSSLIYLYLFGIYDTKLNSHCDFILHTKNKDYTDLNIISANVIVDRKEYTLEQLEGKNLTVNTGLFNMYGGDGGTVVTSFNLKKTPNSFVHFKIHGELISKNGSSHNIIYEKKLSIIKSKRIFPMYKYAYYKLTGT